MREIRIGPATKIDLLDLASDDVTGRWVLSADGIAYRPKDILSGVAATYTAQRAETAVRFRRLGRPHVDDCPNLYLPHSRWRVDFRFGMMASAEKSEAGHRQFISQEHGGIQTEGHGAVREIGHDVRQGGARTGLRRRQPGRLGQEGRCGRAGTRRQPVPEGRTCAG